MRKSQKVYIIAEAGINHNGSLKNCYQLIDSAADSGCDCAKFQFFRAGRLYPRSAGRLNWQDGNKRYSYDIYEAVKSFELPAHWIGKIRLYCAKRKIDFLSSVFDVGGLRYLIARGMKMIKLPSYSITNIPLIEACARYRLPIIMSTGGSNLGQVEEAVAAVNKYHNRISLLHCSIKYPTNLSECNLGVIETLGLAFPDNKIGYSDHTQEVSKAAVQAVYLGAKILEKHITLDKRMKGPDHFFALEPDELKQMVRDVRRAQRQAISYSQKKIDKKIYGSSKKDVFDHERYLRDFCFTTMFAARDFKKGQRIIPRDLLLLRPGKKKRGLEPRYLELFDRYHITAKRNIGFEDSISWKDIL